MLSPPLIGSVFNLRTSKSVQRAGEVVNALTSHELKLEDIDARKLPAKMQKLTRDEVRQRINKARKERVELQKEIEQVSKDRAEYIAKERSVASSKGDSFDETVAQAIRKEAGTKGISY